MLRDLLNVCPQDVVKKYPNLYKRKLIEWLKSMWPFHKVILYKFIQLRSSLQILFLSSAFCSQTNTKIIILPTYCLLSCTHVPAPSLLFWITLISLCRGCCGLHFLPKSNSPDAAVNNLYIHFTHPFFPHSWVSGRFKAGHHWTSGIVSQIKG